MAVLVIADHDNSAVSDATNKTVTAALKFGGDVDVLVAGEGAGDAAAMAAKIDGVRKVLQTQAQTVRRSDWCTGWATAPRIRPMAAANRPRPGSSRVSRSLLICRASTGAVPSVPMATTTGSRSTRAGV